MSNLALATNPSSKILSADSLLVAPDGNMLLIHIVVPGQQPAAAGAPFVLFESEETLALRLAQALVAARRNKPARCTISLPGTVWLEAGEERSAQHYAITLLDALCAALSQ